MELKAETIIPQGTTISLQFYPKSEADAYIRELKDGAVSMFRLREKCRGLDRESPLGQITELLIRPISHCWTISPASAAVRPAITAIRSAG